MILVIRTDIELAAEAGLVGLVVLVVEAALSLRLLQLEAGFLHERLNGSFLLGRQLHARLSGRRASAAAGGRRTTGDREVEKRCDL